MFREFAPPPSCENSKVFQHLLVHWFVNRVAIANSEHSSTCSLYFTLYMYKDVQRRYEQIWNLLPMAR
jgi:hypothetical protein